MKIKKSKKEAFEERFAYLRAQEPANEFYARQQGYSQGWDDCIIYNQIQCLADIREAVGDPEGKLMQDELVERVKAIAKVCEGLESVVSFLGDRREYDQQKADDWPSSLEWARHEGKADAYDIAIREINKLLIKP